MVDRLVSVGDDFTLPPSVKATDENLPQRLGEAALSATYVPIGTDGASVRWTGNEQAVIQAALDAGKTTIRLADPSKTYAVMQLSLTKSVTFIGTDNVLYLDSEIISNGFTIQTIGVRISRTESLRSTNGGTGSHQVFGGMNIKNDRSSTTAALDIAGFQGQGTGANDARTLQIHHYNDNDAMWIDNVGVGTALRLNNARNTTRRSDQGATYVGAGSFMSLREQKTDGTGYQQLFTLDRDANFIWHGSNPRGNKAATFTQGKTDDGLWAFSFDTSNPHANVVRFGDALEVVTDVGGARTVIRSAASKTTGLYLYAGNGPLSLGSGTGQIFVSTTEFTTNTGTNPVKFSRPIRLWNHTSTTSRPTLTAADAGSLITLNGKLQLWTGTAWETVTSA